MLATTFIAGGYASRQATKIAEVEAVLEDIARLRREHGYARLLIVWCG